MLRRLTLTLLFCLATLPASAQGTFSEAQRKEIGEIVRSYLLKNPNVMAEVAQELQRREEATRLAAAQKAISDNKKKLEKAAGDPIGGNAEGSITVVEFFDYNCPYCRKAKPVVKRLLRDDKRIRYVFKEMPILAETSRTAARVALAVWKLHPEKYWSVHNSLMKSNGRVNDKRIREVVEDAGLAWDQILGASKSKDIETTITDNLALAQALNINGTPTFVIGDKIFPGLVPLGQLKSAVGAVAK